jgi:hypothetical protein
MHTYSAPTSPPPRSNKVWWSGRWDQQHDGVVLMVESICEEGFAYMRKVEEDRQKSSQTRARKSYKRDNTVAAKNNFQSPGRALSSHIYMRPCLGVQVSETLSSRPSKTGAADPSYAIACRQQTICSRGSSAPGASGRRVRPYWPTAWREVGERAPVRVEASASWRSSSARPSWPGMAWLN